MADINIRLDDPSNIEIIRDQICGIIALEMQNQYADRKRVGLGMGDFSV